MQIPIIVSPDGVPMSEVEPSLCMARLRYVALTEAVREVWYLNWMSAKRDWISAVREGFDLPAHEGE